MYLKIKKKNNKSASIITIIYLKREVGPGPKTSCLFHRQCWIYYCSLCIRCAP